MKGSKKTHIGINAHFWDKGITSKRNETASDFASKTVS